MKPDDTAVLQCLLTCEEISAMMVSSPTVRYQALTESWNEQIGSKPEDCLNRLGMSRQSREGKSSAAEIGLI